MPDHYDAPIPPGFCQCLSCSKRTGWPGHGHDYRTMTYAGVQGYYGTRKWDCHGRGPVWYGMELELSNCGAAAWRRAFAHLGPILAEVKPDGGLMETTTHPMSYPYFMANYPWGLLEQWRSDGAEAHPQYGGIHIHVTKTGFSGADHMYNWWQLYYRNPRPMGTLGGRRHHFSESPEPRAMRALASRVAGYAEFRRALHTGAVNAREKRGAMYLRPEDKVIIRTAEQAVNAGPSRLDYGPGAGDAIAIRHDGPTFEVRFPGAAIERDLVATRVQLVAAGVEYTRSQEGEGDHSFAPFADWVRDKERYPELAASIAAL
jgi:hypothetical protein